jgi:hypothetical protein
MLFVILVPYRWPKTETRCKFLVIDMMEWFILLYLILPYLWPKTVSRLKLAFNDTSHSSITQFNDTVQWHSSMTHSSTQSPGGSLRSSTRGNDLSNFALSLTKNRVQIEIYRHRHKGMIYPTLPYPWPKTESRWKFTDIETREWST